MDEKYVVFKRDEWEKLEPTFPVEIPRPVEDAVVIRRQDAFAGPALHTYAASIQTAIEILTFAHPEDDYLVRGLEPIRDYFHEQAGLADAVDHKVPD